MNLCFKRDFERERRGDTVIVKLTLSQLLAEAGSLRLLLMHYWRGMLQPAAERVIEADIRPETLATFKPSDYSPQYSGNDAA